MGLERSLTNWVGARCARPPPRRAPGAPGPLRLPLGTSLNDQRDGAMVKLLCCGAKDEVPVHRGYRAVALTLLLAGVLEVPGAVPAFAAPPAPQPLPPPRRRRPPVANIVGAAVQTTAALGVLALAALARSFSGQRRPGCGYVRVGPIDIPITCYQPAHAQVPGAAVVPPEPAGTPALSASVDHRQDGTESEVRWQGTTGTCTAVSFAAVVEHDLRIFGRPDLKVSPMHAWARMWRSPAPGMQQMVQDAYASGITGDSRWPFDPQAPGAVCSWVTGPYCGSVCTMLPATSCGQSPDLVRLADAEAHPVARVTGADHVAHDERTIARRIEAGYDVWASLDLGGEEAWDASNLILIPTDPNKDRVVAHYRPASQGEHAVAIVGFHWYTAPNGQPTYYFLVRNSWGTQWGRDGYAWVQGKTLVANLTEAYVVAVEPW
jgi:Papain family cysteine protease